MREDMELEEIALNIKGVASILESLSCVQHTDVRDSEYGLSLLSSQLFQYADIMLRMVNNQ